MDAPKAQGRRVDQKLRNLIRAKKGRSNMDYKKILAATAAVIGTVAMAEGIVSSSVVGYATDTVAKGKFAIKSLGFENVSDASTDVNDILKGFTGVNFDENYDFQKTAPQIQVLNSNGTYTRYFYLNDGYVDDETFVEGWCDSSGTLVDLDITPGTAFWVTVPGEDTATTAAGAVSSEPSVDVDIPAEKFTLLGNAFPIAVTLNSAGFTSEDISGVDFDENYNFQKTAPQIQVLNSNGTYTRYFYLNDGYVDDETFVEGWCDSSGTLVTDATIPVGAGFWIKSGAAMTATFNK